VDVALGNSDDISEFDDLVSSTLQIPLTYAKSSNQHNFVLTSLT